MEVPQIIMLSILLCEAFKKFSDFLHSNDGTNLSLFVLRVSAHAIHIITMVSYSVYNR